jgi:hypothetical protein
MRSLIERVEKVLEAAHAAGQFRGARAQGGRDGQKVAAPAEISAAKRRDVFTFTLVDGRVFHVAISELAETSTPPQQAN